MSKLDPKSKEYDVVSKHLTELYEARTKDLKNSKIDPGTKATVAANVFGICAILFHERAHVVTSKALSFVFKGRI